MALSNPTEGAVGVIFELCGKTFLTGMILQRKGAPGGSRFRAVGRRHRRRGGAGAGTVTVMTFFMRSRRHAAHMFLLFNVPFNLLSSGRFGICTSNIGRNPAGLEQNIQFSAGSWFPISTDVCQRHRRHPR
jgi:hypothetical protein